MYREHHTHAGSEDTPALGSTSRMEPLSGSVLAPRWQRLSLRYQSGPRPRVTLLHGCIGSCHHGLAADFWDVCSMPRNSLPMAVLTDKWRPCNVGILLQWSSQSGSMGWNPDHITNYPETLGNLHCKLHILVFVMGVTIIFTSTPST